MTSTTVSPISNNRKRRAHVGFLRSRSAMSYCHKEGHSGSASQRDNLGGHELVRNTCEGASLITFAEFLGR